MDFIVSLFSSESSYESSNSSNSSSPSSSSSTYESSEFLLCHDSAIESMIVPHRIPVTVIAGISAACMISGSCFLLLQRNTFAFRRKAALYLVLATAGLLLYLRDSLAIIWTYPAYDCDNTSFYLYYLAAAPFHIIPLLVRSWRTYCIYRETPNILTCRIDTILSERVRRHEWMAWRIALSYIPFVLVVSFVAINQDTAYYVWIGVETTYTIGNFILAMILFRMRHELRSKFLDETRSLYVYATIALIEVIFSNTMYILAYTYYELLIIYYVYGDIIIVSLMWFLTGGRTIYYMTQLQTEIESEKDKVARKSLSLQDEVKDDSRSEEPKRDY
jgi:hypothetical protein